MVRVRNLVLAIAAATALTTEMTHALGLGEVTLQSSLNQPLIAEIELLDAKMPGSGRGHSRPGLARRVQSCRYWSAVLSDRSEVHSR